MNKTNEPKTSFRMFQRSIPVTFDEDKANKTVEFKMLNMDFRIWITYLPGAHCYALHFKTPFTFVVTHVNHEIFDVQGGHMRWLEEELIREAFSPKILLDNIRP